MLLVSMAVNLVLLVLHVWGAAEAGAGSELGSVRRCGDKEVGAGSELGGAAGIRCRVRAEEIRYWACGTAGFGGRNYNFRRHSLSTEIMFFSLAPTD
jgi:hypothetical protein